MGILTLLTLLPLLGAILVLFMPEGNGRMPKIVAISAAVATFAVAVLGVLPSFFPDGSRRFLFEERLSWLPQLGISYHVGVDGISVWLVVLTALLTLVALAFSLYVDKRVKTYFALVLMLETAMIGAFLSLDLVLFFTFFEATLIPMWMLINLWGGERRAYAANKFLIYTFAGSIFLLVGMVAVALQYQRTMGTLSFDVVDIQAAVANGSLWMKDMPLQALLFWPFVIAFLIKCPAFPFHTWIPDTYAESPTAGPILSCAMVKLGSFGLLRFCLPLFPDAVRANLPILMGLAVAGILYGAIVAVVQTDMRRMLAYSSLSHMGFVLLGIFSLNNTGMVGGAFQQLSHGVTAGMLFLLVGYLYQRRGSTMFRDFGGLKAQMPVFATLLLIAMLGGVGLPGTNGYIGESLAMYGAFATGYLGQYGLSTVFVVIAGASMVVAAAYMLYFFQQVCYGPLDNPINRRLRDLKRWEIGVAAVLAVLILWGGLHPSTFIRPLETSVQVTREMATEPIGRRPTWTNRTNDVVVLADEASERDRG